jgi:hypothetical protein
MEANSRFNFSYSAGAEHIIVCRTRSCVRARMSFADSRARTHGRTRIRDAAVAYIEDELVAR